MHQQDTGHYCLWDVTWCNSRDFSHQVPKESCPLKLVVNIGYNTKEAENVSAACCLAMPCNVLELLFEPDDGGSIFLRNLDGFI
jgi:hypothetical protein